MTDEQNALIAMAYEAAAGSLCETSIWCDSQERTDDGWRNGVTDARKYHTAKILSLTPDDARAALERVKEQARAEERERWAKFCDLQADRWAEDIATYPAASYARFISAAIRNNRDE